MFLDSFTNLRKIIDTDNVKVDNKFRIQTKSAKISIKFNRTDFFLKKTWLFIF